MRLEVDGNPPPRGVTETHFVSLFNELFPILKYDLPTLFAGKALAVLFRPYQRGRDFYDLVWFRSQKVRGNMAYFRSGLRKVEKAPLLKTWNDVLGALDKKAAAVHILRLMDFFGKAGGGLLSRGDVRPILNLPQQGLAIRLC